jgi:hypothetical protein
LFAIDLALEIVSLDFQVGTSHLLKNSLDYLTANSIRGVCLLFAIDLALEIASLDFQVGSSHHLLKNSLDIYYRYLKANSTRGVCGL